KGDARLNRQKVKFARGRSDVRWLCWDSPFAAHAHLEPGLGAGASATTGNAPCGDWGSIPRAAASTSARRLLDARCRAHPIPPMLRPQNPNASLPLKGLGISMRSVTNPP